MVDCGFHRCGVNVVHLIVILASSQAQAEGNHKVAQLELEHNPLTTCALVAYLHMLRLLLRLGLAEENLSLP